MPIEVGDIVEGKVSNITNYGAFIQLEDNKVGLVHISEIADTYVENIKEFLKENQEIKVKVLAIEKNGKISLSIKKAEQKQDISKQETTKPNRHEKVYSRNDSYKNNNSNNANMSFEDRLSKFMKESEERLSDLKKSFESKRGSGSYRKSAQF
jgi:S1 RNA binding domain protein